MDKFVKNVRELRKDSPVLSEKFKRYLGIDKGEEVMLRLYKVLLSRGISGRQIYHAAMTDNLDELVKKADTGEMYCLRRAACRHSKGWQLI